MDINQMMANVDPKIYLPKMFSNYYKFLGMRIIEVSPHWDSKETLSWKALEQLYQVDIDNFVEF